VRRSAWGLLLWWLWCLPLAAGAASYTAQVIAVLDGDTVMVVRDNRKITLRLAGIDAPEKQQAFGIASRDALAALVLRKPVRVTTKAVDDYGRVIALIDVGRLNVNEELLRRGLAWEYSHYHSNPRWLALQSRAQAAKRGLWAAANPEPPWQFRKAQATAHKPPAAATACGSKHYCSQMVSCEEATFYLTQCHVKTLDKNGNGLPCENLCRRPAVR
jgi:micrococcal nuclease